MAAVGIGLQMQGGRRTNTKCIVATVRWKRTPQRLVELGLKPLPRTITVRVKGRTYDVPVDVEGARGLKLGTLHGIVGCSLTATWVNSPGGERGVVGSIVRQAGSVRILTAGHVARRMGAVVSVQLPTGTVNGTATDVLLDNNLDHALIAPLGSLPAQAHRLVSGPILAGLRHTGAVSHGEDVFFLDQDRSLHSVNVERIGVSQAFRLTASTQIMLHNLVETNRCESRKGDSGTLLYDNAFLAVGTLVGSFNGRDYFLPCDTSFAAIGVTLVNQ